MAPISKKRAILGIIDDYKTDHYKADDYTSAMSNSCSDSESNSGSYPESPGDGDGMSLDGRQFARVNRVILDKNSDEYRKRRERNNLAVKKSRTKSKLKSIQTAERVNLLKQENHHLAQKVEILSKELRLLKEIFVAHASNAHGTEITEFDLKLLISSDILDVPYHDQAVPQRHAQQQHRPHQSAPHPLYSMVSRLDHHGHHRMCDERDDF